MCGNIARRVASRWQVVEGNPAVYKIVWLNNPSHTVSLMLSFFFFYTETKKWGITLCASVIAIAYMHPDVIPMRHPTCRCLPEFQ